MNDTTKRPLLADIRTDLGALGVELREMVSARWELARLEIESDIRSAVQLAVAWLVAVVMSLTALPLVAAGLAEYLDGWHGIPRSAWLFVFAAALLFIASLGSYLAWRRFRRNFTGLCETLEELQEDMVWLRDKGNDGNAETNSRTNCQ